MMKIPYFFPLVPKPLLGNALDSLFFMMTLTASQRTGLFPGFLFIFMTRGTMFVHNLLFFEFSFGFQFLNGTGSLRKIRVADIAVFQDFLMLMMGKGNISLLTAEKLHFIRAFVLLLRDRYDRGSHSDNYQQNDFAFHSVSPF